MKKFVLFLFLILSFIQLRAQKISIASNLAQYANLLTMNAEISVSMSRYTSLSLGARYNPWDLLGNKNIRNKQRTAYVELRYWPWYVFSGWWFSTALQYKEYSQMGIFSKYRYVGDKYSMSFGSGYTHMLSSHLNLDFGIKLYAGVDKYHKYATAHCGLSLENDRKAFVGLDEILLGISYVF